MHVIQVLYHIIKSIFLSQLGCLLSLLTDFFQMFPFDPPENIRKPCVFWCFQGDQQETVRKALIIILIWFLPITCLKDIHDIMIFGEMNGRLLQKIYFVKKGKEPY